MADSAPTAEELLAHTDWLTRLARALVGDAAAGDVVQDTYEVALGNDTSRRGPLRPWLGGVARNVVRMTMRGRVRRERREQAVPVVDEVPSPEALLARAQIQQKVNRLVLELPEPLRSTLLLRFFEGLSAADIARAQRIPAATVRSRLKDALDRIRAELDTEHGNDRKAWAGLLAPLAASAPRNSATATAGASVLAKVVIATLVATVIVGSARLARLWGSHRTPEPTATASSPPAVTARVKLITSPRGVPPTRDDDPAGTLLIAGHVLDDHDAPVAHARVAIDANPPREIETEADGAFAFDGLIGRDYRIEATVGERYAGPARLRLTDNPAPVTLRMRQAGTVDVTVTERDSGAPVNAAEVELRSGLSSLTWRATTNRDGIARLTGVGAGSSPLVVRADGYAPSAMMFGRSGNLDLVEHAALSLARGAALSGRVVTADGAPVANARVVATNASEPLPLVDPGRDAVVTDATGAFSIAALSAGTWRITATAEPYAPTTSAPFALDGHHARSDVELAIGPGAVLHGVVTDSAGAPVPAAEVSVVVHGYVPWRARRQAFTDSTGEFSIAGLERRAVDVVARHDRGASAIASIDLTGDRELALKLEPSRVVTGTVVDHRGQPIADAQVILVPDGGSIDRGAWTVRGVQETTSERGGEFRFSGLPSGSFRVRAARPSASEAALWLATGVATQPNAAPITVFVPADGRAFGKVQLADGAPVKAFSVAVDNARALVASDGAFSISAPAGTYALTINGPDFVTTTRDVTITEGTDTDVGTFTVTAGRSVSGRVSDRDGLPVAHATVAAGALLSGGGAELFIPSESIAAKATQTDEDGRFLLAGFPPGSLTVVAGRADTGRSASIQLPASADSVTLDLVVAATSRLEGKISRNGAPLADAHVIASPIGAMWESFFVTTGSDGTFAFDALAPGSYVVYPMLGRGGGGPPGELYMQRAEVVLGTTSKIEVDATPGPITLAVSVTTDHGAPLARGQVGTIALAIHPQTVEELRDGSYLPTGDHLTPMHGAGVRDGAASIAGLRPGTHTLCAMIGDARVASTVKLTCTPLSLTTAPHQTAAIVVPSAWLTPP